MHLTMVGNSYMYFLFVGLFALVTVELFVSVRVIVLVLALLL